jgi:hypothetical protein
MTADRAYLDLQADDDYFASLDEHDEDLPHTLRRPGRPAAICASPCTAGAQADRPLHNPLPGGRSATVFTGHADCHPWEAAVRWVDGQRVCWPCLEALLEERLNQEEAPGSIGEPGA